MPIISKVDKHRSLSIEFDTKLLINRQISEIDKKLIARFLVIIDFDRFTMLKFDLIDFNRQVSEFEQDAGDKTAVERGLTKREPNSHSKLNPESFGTLC